MINLFMAILFPAVIFAGIIIGWKLAEWIDDKYF